MANQRDDMDDRQQEDFAWAEMERDYYEKWLEQQAEEMGSK